MISFRISADDYDRLRAAASLSGAANLSELARVALNRLLDAGNNEPIGISEQVRNLRVKIQDITLELERLSQAVPRAASAAAPKNYVD